MGYLSEDEWAKAVGAQIEREFVGWPPALPPIDTDKEVCPDCDSVGHTSRSHILYHAGDKVLLLVPMMTGAPFADAISTVRGHRLYEVLLEDGRIMDLESVALYQRGEYYAEWKREREAA